LDDRQRLCIVLSALSTQGKREQVLNVLGQAIKQRQAPPTFFSELFIHLSLLLGFPTMLDGLEKLSALRAPSQRALSRRNTHRQRHRKGMKMLRRIYGEQAEKLLASLAELHVELPQMIIRNVYGEVFGRPGLTLAEREIINVTVLTIQALPRQLYSHIRGALRVGVPPTALRALFVLLRSRFGVSVDYAEQMLRLLARTDSR
jgi:4-carboxymuconolactone decarboxylase